MTREYFLWKCLKLACLQLYKLELFQQWRAVRSSGNFHNPFLILYFCINSLSWHCRSQVAYLLSPILWPRCFGKNPEIYGRGSCIAQQAGHPGLMLYHSSCFMVLVPHQEMALDQVLCQLTFEEFDQVQHGPQLMVYSEIEKSVPSITLLYH